MRIIVEIECETITEFHSHLTVLKTQIRKQSHKLKLNPLTDAFPIKVDLYDDNCYGTHDVIIKQDKKPKS